MSGDVFVSTTSRHKVLFVVGYSENHISPTLELALERLHDTYPAYRYLVSKYTHVMKIGDVRCDIVFVLSGEEYAHYLMVNE